MAARALVPHFQADFLQTLFERLTLTTRNVFNSIFLNKQAMDLIKCYNFLTLVLVSFTLCPAVEQRPGNQVTGGTPRALGG